MPRFPNAPGRAPAQKPRMPGMAPPQMPGPMRPIDGPPSTAHRYGPPAKPMARGGVGGVAGGGHPSYMADGGEAAPMDDQQAPPDPQAQPGAGTQPEDADWPMWLHYHGEQDVCQACQFVDEQGFCPIVKQPVDRGGHCDGFTPAGEEQQEQAPQAAAAGAGAEPPEDEGAGQEEQEPQ